MTAKMKQKLEIDADSTADKIGMMIGFPFALILALDWAFILIVETNPKDLSSMKMTTTTNLS